MKLEEKLAERILEITNREYLFLKMEKTSTVAEDYLYMAPELLPRVKSDQIHALIRAISIVLADYFAGDKSDNA